MPKPYKHLTTLEPPEASALKEAKEQTGQSINQLLTLCVRRALPAIRAELAAKPSKEAECDWNAFMDQPRRKVKRYVADEIRALSNRR